MKCIQFVATYSDGPSLTIDVKARDINSGMTKALDVARSYVGSGWGREVVGVAFLQVQDANTTGSTEPSAFKHAPCDDFVAAAVSRHNPNNAFYVERVAS